MTRSTSSLKSFAQSMVVPRICILSVILGNAAATCWAQVQDTKDSARQRRAAELDKKVDELLEQFSVLKSKLAVASDQAATNIGAELDILGSELAEAYNERETAFRAKVQQWSESIDEAWEDLEVEGTGLEADATKELDEILQSWNASYERLRVAYQEHVDHLIRELDSLEKQLSTTADELSEEWVATRADLRKRYQATAKEMRGAYRESINALQKEIRRLKKWAAAASEERRENLLVMADSLSQQMNVLQQELQQRYREAANKADAYLAQTKTQLSEAGVEVKTRLQAEADHVSAVVCELFADLAAGSDAYLESLDAQLAALKQRAETAAGDADRKLSKAQANLRAQLEQAEEQSQQAYQSYIVALNADIDRLNQRIAEADDRTRARLVKAIERRQAELEKAKQGLNRKE